MLEIVHYSKEKIVAESQSVLHGCSFLVMFGLLPALFMANKNFFLWLFIIAMVTVGVAEIVYKKTVELNFVKGRILFITRTLLKTKKTEESIDIIKKIALLSVGYRGSVGYAAIYQFCFCASSNQPRHMEIAHLFSQDDSAKEKQVLEFWQEVCEYICTPKQDPNISQNIKKIDQKQSSSIKNTTANPWLDQIFCGEKLILNLQKDRSSFIPIILVVLFLALFGGAMLVKTIMSKGDWFLIGFVFLWCSVPLIGLWALFGMLFSPPAQLRINTTEVNYYKKNVLVATMPIREITHISIAEDGHLIVHSNFDVMNIGGFEDGVLKIKEYRKIKKVLLAIKAKNFAV